MADRLLTKSPLATTPEDVANEYSQGYQDDRKADFIRNRNANIEAMKAKEAEEAIEGGFATPILDQAGLSHLDPNYMARAKRHRDEGIKAHDSSLGALGGAGLGAALGLGGMAASKAIGKRKRISDLEKLLWILGGAGAGGVAGYAFGDDIGDAVRGSRAEKSNAPLKAKVDAALSATPEDLTIAGGQGAEAPLQNFQPPKPIDTSAVNNLDFNL